MYLFVGFGQALVFGCASDYLGLAPGRWAGIHGCRCVGVREGCLDVLSLLITTQVMKVQPLLLKHACRFVCLSCAKPAYTLLAAL